MFLINLIRRVYMNKLSAIVLAGLLSTSFAMDEFNPVSAGKGQVDLGIAYGSVTGGWDQDGEFQEIGDDNSITATMIGIQAKYGVVENMDVELVVPYMMISSKFGSFEDDRSGLAQPELGVKYVTPAGFGGFVNVELPFGSEDIVGDSPKANTEIGAIFNMQADALSLFSSLSYTLTLADGDLDPGDVIALNVRPQYALNEQLSLFMGVGYEMAGEDSFDGTAISDSQGSLLGVAPGVVFKASETFQVEAEFDYPVMGTNTSAFWSVAVTPKLSF
jgi:opacity protein-like surface antigen